MTEFIPADIAPLIAALARSTLIVLVAGLAIAALRTLRMAAAARHLVWLLAFAALALLPVLMLALPRISVIIPHSLMIFAGAPDLSSPGEHVRDSARYDGVVRWVWAIYAFGATALLTRLVGARFALASLWRRARQVDARTDELAERLGITGPVALRFSDAPIAPMTWADRILLPAEAAEWPPAQLRDVLLHELSHMARRDSLIQLLAAVVRSFFWFSPAVWIALSQLRIEQEHACDECVLLEGAKPDAYAQTLLDIAVGLRAPQLGMGVSTAMVQRSDLERRVVEILKSARGRPLAPLHTIALSVMVLTSAALIAVAQPIDSARMLPPLTPLTSPLAPLSARLQSLPPLATPLWMPDDAPNTNRE